MGFYPENPNLGQTIQTDSEGVSVDKGFLAHFQVSAANAVALSAAGCLALTALTAAAQAIVAAITNPAVPRNVSIVGNAAGIAGDVVITGTNYAGAVITETLALNGVTPVLGNKAFRTITQIALPIQTHVGTDQVSVGFDDKLGLPYTLTHNTVLAAYFNNVKEATAPTIATNAAAIESNTMLLNSALDGHVVDAYLIV